MLATRPSTAESAARAREEKEVPGIERAALKEERKPLLDLDDVERLELELAACFDAPPPPPLNMRREGIAGSAVVPWTGSAQNPPVRMGYVPSPPTKVVAATAAVDLQQQRLLRMQRHQEELTHEPEQEQAQRQTTVSDFSSLYSPHRAVSSSQVYPEFVPATAPSTQAMRTNSVPAQGRAAAAPSETVQAASAQVAERRETVANRTVDLSTGSAAVSADESSAEVVEELLSENEKLRLIIQDLKEELLRVSVQNENGGAQVVTRPESAGARAPAAAAGQAPRTRTLASAMAQFPGAQAEANRRRNEQRRQAERLEDLPLQIQQQQYMQQQQQQMARGRSEIQFKCENCPQWLRVPGNAQLVYCPTCSHTSQMTADATVHYPSNNETGGNRAGNTRGASAAAGTRPQQQEQGEEAGIMGYIRSIWNS